MSRNKDRLIQHLADLGYVVDATGIMHAKGWTRSIHAKFDDTTVNWDANVKSASGRLWHAVSYDKIADCARYGITVDEEDGLLWCDAKHRAKAAKQEQA